jgi:two-component system, cell cycle sensor histidine kinase and response regulator CckA
MSEREARLGNSLDNAEASIQGRFVALFEHMQEGAALHELVLDEQGEPVDYRIVDINPQFEKHTGRRRADVVGRLASQVYGTGTAPFLKEYASVAMGGPPLHFEVYFPPFQRHFAISVASTEPKSFATIFSDTTLSRAQAEVVERSRLSLQALLDNQPHLAWLKDREGRFLAVNKAFAQACGQASPDAVVGKTDLDVWPLQLAEAYRADDRAVMQAATQTMVEEQIAEVDGMRWFETYKSPVFEPDGSIVGTTGIARDITERKRAEEERLRNERKLGRILDLAPDPIAVINARGQWSFANQAFCELCGYPRSELLGKKTTELELWEAAGASIDGTWRIEGGGPVEGAELILRSRDGVHHHVELTVAVAEFDEATSRILAGRDVTRSRLDAIALREAERAAAKSRERLLSVSELAHIGHFTMDLRSGSVTWTPELYRIFGRDLERFEPTVESTRSLVFPEDLPTVNGGVMAARESGQAQRFHFRVVRPSGEVRHCLGIVEAESASTLPADRVYGLLQDLTELRRAEEERRELEQQVMQSQKLESLGVLAGGIAHDFNNLLTSILGNADLAQSEIAPTNPARSYLEDIETVSRRAADLCRQMLAYSGKGRFVVQAISLNEVVREMAHLLSVSISKKVVIKYSFFPELPSAMADATQMRQVVMNLITNASEAIGEVSGVVTLSTGMMDCDDDYLKGAVGDAGHQPAGQYVYLEVSDTGCGMDQDTLGRIFDPFFTTKFTGRGLGLAAVLGIVRGHKGALRVYSEKGRGTTFKVLLPAHHQTPLPPTVETDGQKVWRGSGLVLLADDEESIRRMGRRLLERAGFEVLVAEDGQQAVELFLENRARIRLVVLDMTMPHLDGEACYRELRRIDSAVKVIMTSGYNEQEVISRFVGKGLAGFVQKPYKPADFLAIARRVLGEE